jgi:hypothetical protein
MPNPPSEPAEMYWHTRSLQEGWNWVSFPVLDRSDGSFVNMISVTNPLLSNASIFLREQLGTTLNSFYHHHIWLPPFYVNSVNGYKILVDDPLEEHNVKGTTNPANTPIRMESRHTNNGAQWIGFFLPYEMYLLDAVTPEQLHMFDEIRTQHGGIYRISDTDFIKGNHNLVVRFGDMVKVRPRESFEFQWLQDPTIATTVVSPQRRETPQFFEYRKLADFISVFVEKGKREEGRGNYAVPIEIGVKINKEIRGAVVVRDGINEILVYTDMRDYGREIQLVLAFEGGEIIHDVPFNVINHQTGEIESRPLVVRQGVHFHHLISVAKMTHHPL